MEFGTNATDLEGIGILSLPWSLMSKKGIPINQTKTREGFLSLKTLRVFLDFFSWSPSWRVTNNFWKGHLTIHKKVTSRIARNLFLFVFWWAGFFESLPSKNFQSRRNGSQSPPAKTCGLIGDQSTATSNWCCWRTLGVEPLGFVRIKAANLSPGHREFSRLALLFRGRFRKTCLFRARQCSEIPRRPKL